MDSKTVIDDYDNTVLMMLLPVFILVLLTCNINLKEFKINLRLFLLMISMTDSGCIIVFANRHNYNGFNHFAVSAKYCKELNLLNLENLGLCQTCFMRNPVDLNRIIR